MKKKLILKLRFDKSGKGVAKEKPYYVLINDKSHLRFKTKELAKDYFKGFL